MASGGVNPADPRAADWENWTQNKGSCREMMSSINSYLLSSTCRVEGLASSWEVGLTCKTQTMSPW